MNMPGTLVASSAKDEVVDLELEGWEKVIVTKQGLLHRQKAVIIATGAEPRTLGVKGEAELKGKGVSYCATLRCRLSLKIWKWWWWAMAMPPLKRFIYLTRFAAKVTIVVIHDEGVLDATKIIQERALPTKKSTLSGTLSWRKSKATASSRRWSVRTSRRER